MVQMLPRFALSSNIIMLGFDYTLTYMTKGHSDFLPHTHHLSTLLLLELDIFPYLNYEQCWHQPPCPNLLVPMQDFAWIPLFEAHHWPDSLSLVVWVLRFSSSPNILMKFSNRMPVWWMWNSIAMRFCFLVFFFILFFWITTEFKHLFLG